MRTRENELLTLLARGHTVKEAGQRMGITQRTAETHARNARVRLGARNIVHAIAMHLRDGHVECPTCRGVGRIPDGSREPT